MPIEIERKFRVTSDAWRAAAGPGRRFCQGYVARSASGQVRVRRAGASAYVTIKGARDGIARPEFEYSIPVEEAEEMLKSLCLKPLIEKTRYVVPAGGHLWEVDVFHGVSDPEGGGDLIVAEIELDAADQPIALPEWVGREVTHDRRYSNVEIVLSRRTPSTPTEADGRRSAAVAHNM